jgi:5-methylcytosine-specific restriction endonuclease McrA
MTTVSEAQKQLIDDGWSPQSIELFLKSDGRCAYCDLDLLGDARLHFDFYTFDHIVPGMLGGGDEDKNLVLACRSCNRIKGTFDPSKGGAVVGREALIATARDYIRPIRENNDRRLKDALPRLKACGLAR